MKILIATSFYSEYELYDTNDPDGLVKDIRNMAKGKEVDTSRHKLLGYQDTIDTQEAIAQADKVVFIDNFE